MRVLVPNDVKIVELRTGRPVLVQPRPEDKPKPWVISHEEFVLDVLCGSPILIRNGSDDRAADGLKRQQRIQKAFKNCMPGNRIEIGEADWLIAMDAIKNLSWAPDAVRHAAQLLPHIQAWEEADAAPAVPANFVCYCPEACEAHPKGGGGFSDRRIAPDAPKP